jgi:transposase
MIALTRARHDPATRAYLERKIAEGKTRKEAIRALKRHLARRFHRLLAEQAATINHEPIPVGAPSPMLCLT